LLFTAACKRSVFSLVAKAHFVGAERDWWLVGTLLCVKSSVEALEGNKVKVVVELDEAEFEKDLDAAFRRLAQEVRLPGFRPGKAPRKVLEARIGQGYAREEAFREALPSYYANAVKEHEVDVIAPPEIDITNGREDGAVAFDAVVEVRPSVTVDGYQSLEVEITSPTITDEDVDQRVNQFVSRFGELESIDRAAVKGDTVVIDIATYQHGEPLDAMTATDYAYEVGSGGLLPELDEALEGVSEGDEVQLEVDHPNEEEEEPLEFQVSVLEVQEKKLPELTDEFVVENSEFETVAEMRASYEKELTESRLQMADAQRRNGVAEALGELVDDASVPEALVNMETDNRIEDMVMRLRSSGIDLEQYMQITGQSQEDMVAGLRVEAASGAKLDLALRSIVVAEGLDVSDEEIDDEFSQAAEQMGRSVEEIRSEVTERGQLPSIKSSLSKQKALDWVVERTKLIDEDDGSEIDPALLETPNEAESGIDPETDPETDESGASEE